MRKVKYDPVILQQVGKLLDQLTKRHGYPGVRHAVNRWTTVNASKRRIAKRQAALQAELTQLSRQLRGKA